MWTISVSYTHLDVYKRQPLMSRFAVIDIPDYTDEEKKVIFQRFALRKVFERMGMKEEELSLIHI